MKNNNKIIAANWKMNGSEELMKEFSQLTRAKHNDIIICPPFTLLDSAKTILPNFIKIGAQNCSEEEKGAFTGEISASMLQEKSVSHVLLGHSERRTLFNETDDMILKKVKAAINSKLTPIVCIGETLSEKEANKTLKVLDSQINGSLAKIEPNEQVIVAYEPVWAIGTGLTPTLDEINQVHELIKNFDQKFINFKVLYGGSVKSSNSKEITKLSHVDGCLIGGASLKVDDFNTIIS